MLAEPEKPQTDAVLGLPPATFVSLCNSLTEMYLKQVSSMQNGIGETATTAQRVMLAWCFCFVEAVPSFSSRCCNCLFHCVAVTLTFVCQNTYTSALKLVCRH